MDQVKEYLKLAIKYRFWIAVGVSCLLPLIGYFVASGAIRADAAAKKSTIEGADKEVQKYASGKLPNAQYAPMVKERHTVLDGDVNSAWRFLFNRQAPILAWPEKVADRFPGWGRKWPAGVDANAVQQAIYDFVTIYEDEVQSVYKVFKPFDPESGDGIVSAPPLEDFLHPSVFDPNQLPTDLSIIWNAQEKLWVQRAMLEVVAKMNEKAKDWDEAPIKQVNNLVVANSGAQDQKSAIKGEQILERPAILPPGAPAQAAAPATGGGGTQANQMAQNLAAGSANNAKMRNAMNASALGMGGMGSSSEGPSDDGSVKFIKSNHKQFEIVPVYISVMIEQDRIHEFLIALEESPMAIKVNEFEQLVPDPPLKKPEKGMTRMAGGANMGGGVGGMGAMSKFGNRGGMARGGGDEMMQMRGKGGGSQPAPGMIGGAGAGNASRNTNRIQPKRNIDPKKDREEKAKKAEEAAPDLVFDPYFNVVQLEIYGQARLFNRPTEEPKSATAASSTPAGAQAQTPAAPGAASPPVAPGALPGGLNNPAQAGQPAVGNAAPDAAAAKTAPGTAPTPADAAKTASGTAPAPGDASKKAEAAKPASETPEAKPASNQPAAEKPSEKAQPADGKTAAEPKAKADEPAKPDLSKPDAAKSGSDAPKR